MHLTRTPALGPDAQSAVDPAPPSDEGFYLRVGKPFLDRVLAGVALLVLSPLMLLIGAVVAVTLGGPVIFGQQRIGQGGRPFTVYKFRTMHPDRRRRSVTYDGPERRLTHKSGSDPRLTPTGRVLRRLSLDELPQLVNVMRGEMSMVGPRPELPQVVDAHYSSWMHRRHDVRPGMTGLWQVSERGNGMMHEHVDVDLDYVDQVSLTTDLRIILRTLPAALGTHQGA